MKKKIKTNNRWPHERKATYGDFDRRTKVGSKGEGFDVKLLREDIAGTTRLTYSRQDSFTAQRHLDGTMLRSPLKVQPHP